jgi:hypothetical protein
MMKLVKYSLSFAVLFAVAHAYETVQDAGSIFSNPPNHSTDRKDI